MKTTSVRKLLPESWGFLCPVHTPDGTPCGLLSHLAAKAGVICSINNATSWRVILSDILISLGMIPADDLPIDLVMRTTSQKFQTCRKTDNLHVSLDGVVLGFAPDLMCARASVILRRLKVKAFSSLGIEETIQIAHLKHQGPDASSPFAGLFLISQPARLIRPVLQCGSISQIELIGPFEQSTLQIACDARGFAMPGAHSANLVTKTHAEIDPTYMLSVLASLTPFSDFNQSPRNMYQCQMGKQTMGTPAHSLRHRCDNKLYRILTPQIPLVCTQDCQKCFELDPYAQGTNSIVAVIAYTGYDMEDAMVVNKSAYERGFGHGLVYKSVVINLSEEAERRRMDSSDISAGSFQFGNINQATQSGTSRAIASTARRRVTTLGEDGLPAVGQRIGPGDPLWCACSKDNNEAMIGNHKDAETAYVDNIRFIGCHPLPSLSILANLLTPQLAHRCRESGPEGGRQKVSITLRFRRNPVIGDKFSSRHGQKGVLSSLWPESDMPFSESGFTPDIIINPHAFPSRMTIGMLIESMAGKSAALSGCSQDGTSFGFHEKIHVTDYLGSQLSTAGYEYYGSELVPTCVFISSDSELHCYQVYSGFSGLAMRMEVFVGVVYYQRLRHMVSDKSQVRGTGPVHPLTNQPIKGRKHHGGIRLGEMERDALLAHGTTFLLHDRLVNCSDSHGALLYTSAESHELGGEVAMPYVFRYLKNELAAMNIQLRLSDDAPTDMK